MASRRQQRRRANTSANGALVRYDPAAAAAATSAPSQPVVERTGAIASLARDVDQLTKLVNRLLRPGPSNALGQADVGGDLRPDRRPATVGSTSDAISQLAPVNAARSHPAGSGFGGAARRERTVLRYTFDNDFKAGTVTCAPSDGDKTKFLDVFNNIRLDAVKIITEDFGMSQATGRVGFLLFGKKLANHSVAEIEARAGVITFPVAKVPKVWVIEVPSGYFDDLSSKSLDDWPHLYVTFRRFSLASNVAEESVMTHVAHEWLFSHDAN